MCEGKKKKSLRVEFACRVVRRLHTAAEDGSVVLRGDPRRFHPRTAVPVRDQPHLPLLLQVPHLLWRRDGERGPTYAHLLAATRQRQEFRVSSSL